MRINTIFVVGCIGLMLVISGCSGSSSSEAAAEVIPPPAPPPIPTPDPDPTADPTPIPEARPRGVVMGVGSRDTEAVISTALAGILADPRQVDTIAAIQYRTRWSLLEPQKGAYSFEHLLEQVRFVKGTVRSDGKPWRTQIFISVFTGAPDWLYDDGVFPFYTMGRQVFSATNIPLPYDEIYLQRAQEFIANLHQALNTGLSADEYQSIELIGIGGPGGYLDQFFPQVTADPVMAETDDSARVNIRCPGTATPYYHVYAEEYGQDCFTGGNPYTPEPFDRSNDSIYRARQMITDQLFSLFGDDMYIERPLLMFTPNANGDFKAQLAEVLVSQVADNVRDYGERYILKINALGSSLNPVRWDFENILEHHRITDASPIAFEFVDANQSGLGASVQEVIELGINRGASYLLLFPPLAVDNLQALEFAKSYYESEDLTPPSAINDLLAQTGSASGSIVVNWTAPGEDDTPTGPLGTVSKYQIRYSTTAAIVTQSDWDVATPYAETQLPLPAFVGKQESITLQGFTVGTLYYISVAAVDDAGFLVRSLGSPSAVSGN